jgi:hypothetical protein
MADKATNAAGPAHLAPQPAPGLAFDARGVLSPLARESVADALLIVESYGPWGADLNDAYRRQIVLADEVRRLVDKCNGYIADNARLAEKVKRLRAWAEEAVSYVGCETWSPSLKEEGEALLLDLGPNVRAKPGAVGDSA